jgi:hypothetical protein
MQREGKRREGGTNGGDSEEGKMLDVGIVFGMVSNQVMGVVALFES